MKLTHPSAVSKAVLTALVVSATSGSVWAADYDEANLQDLGKVVLVTASRLSEEKVDVPADTTVITAKDIEKGNFNSVSDALKSENIPVVQKGFDSYVELNGDNRVLVLVNGRKINFDHLMVQGSDYAANIDQIPVDAVDRIEVVKGPNSALYGEKAMAGVINIITKTPTMGQKTTVKGELGNWGYRRGVITTQGGDEKNGYFISYSKERRDNYDYKDNRGNKHEFPDSSLDKDTLIARYDRYIGDDRLSLDFSRTERNDGFGIYLKDPYTATAYGAGNKTKGISASYGVTYEFGTDSGTFVKAYRNTDKSDSPFATDPYSHNLSANGLDAQKTWTLGNHTLISGISYLDEHLRESNRGTLDKNARTKAIFVEDKWNLGNGWSANLGTRYEDNNTFGGDWASHIGINKKLDENTHVYASWGQAVNNPTLKMMYADTLYMKGNPDLKQETSKTYTLGMDSQINDKLSVSASIFQSEVKNALQWIWPYSPTDARTMYFNANKEKRKGLNLSANYKVNDAWKVRLSASFLSQKYDTPIGEDKGKGMTTFLKNKNPNVYGLDVTYEKNKWLVSNSFRYVTGRSESYYTDSAYFTWDMNVSYKVNESTKVYAQGINLTDEAYEIEPYNFPVGAYAMPGRHYVVGVEHTF